MNTNTNTLVPVLARLPYPPALADTIAARTIGIAYTANYCEAETDVLGACGCIDYHMSDCPTRG